MVVRGRRPDFFVRSPVIDFLAEVKSFEAVGPLVGRGRVFTVGIAQLLKPIRGALHEAAAQLRPYGDLALPRVVVLDDWRNVGLVLETEILIQLFGELQFVVPVSMRPGLPPPLPPRLAYGGGRSLGYDSRTYISAVVLNEVVGPDDHEDLSTERPMRARVLHNPFATQPLPLATFSEPRDQHLVHDGTAWLVGTTEELAERVDAARLSTATPDR
jgi:hypothetical protein